MAATPRRRPELATSSACASSFKNWALARSPRSWGDIGRWTATIAGIAQRELIAPCGLLQIEFVTLTQYDQSFTIPAAFPSEDSLPNIFGEVLSAAGLTQFRIAETEKYAHVTYFFNNGREIPFPGEERKLIPSPKVATYDLKPEMSAYEVTDEAVKQITSRRYDFVLINYANPDMVGHTGVFEAAVKAVEAVDECLGRVVEAALSVGGEILVTADHGNADIMKDEQGRPHTAHTHSPGPLIYIGPRAIQLSEGGALCDIAPTLLEHYGTQTTKRDDGTEFSADLTP
jgi:2,3-bisphosphoglycerate-independent phosphoglycerate mutase